MGDGVNRYAYVRGNPILNHDPTGFAGATAELVASMDVEEIGGQTVSISQAGMTAPADDADFEIEVFADPEAEMDHLSSIGWGNLTDGDARRLGALEHVLGPQMVRRGDGSGYITSRERADKVVLQDDMENNSALNGKMASGLGASVAAGGVALWGGDIDDMHIAADLGGVADNMLHGPIIQRIAKQNIGSTSSKRQGAAAKQRRYVPAPTEVRGNSPVTIPNNAVSKVQPKTGYDQIRFTWPEPGMKYEARWHTRTPGAPKGQGDTWVIERKILGSPNVQNSSSRQILLIDGSWISKRIWQQAKDARRLGVATPAHNALLTAGHHKASGYRGAD